MPAAPKKSKSPPRLDAGGIYYAKSIFKITAGLTAAPGKQGVRVTLSTPVAAAEIHYTLDGSEPLASSLCYEKPLHLKKTANLPAALFQDGRRVKPKSIICPIRRRNLSRRSALSRS